MGSRTRLSRSTIVPHDPRRHSSAFSNIFVDSRSGRVAECPASAWRKAGVPVLCQQVSKRYILQRCGSQVVAKVTPCRAE